MRLACGGLALVLGLLAGGLYLSARMPGHMLAHLLLSLAVPPLLLLAAPRWRPRVPAWAGGLLLAAVTVLSHLPQTMMMQRHHPALLLLDGVLFFGAGVAFALGLWPATVAALGVTVVQMAVCALTGAWVAFGDPMPGAAAAGTLMWVGGGLTYSAAALTIIVRLVSKEEGASSYAR
ncbi:hypothetical protein [Deinococcus ruber]|uniref:Cytochrome c oxidase assembly protein n=1 Tax=Deinococcus ruber TaxID=1848197 RepID=A0A918C8R6_9DEIO|nr:hypothetical protein [Deinococcus ruber]GGR10530.1 hypothetical protein GCM10008957_24020 [Deinococcus ruber]